MILLKTIGVDSRDKSLEGLLKLIGGKQAILFVGIMPNVVLVLVLRKNMESVSIVVLLILFIISIVVEILKK
jgi:diacylglycerol kinase